MNLIAILFSIESSSTTGLRIFIIPIICALLVLGKDIFFKSKKIKEEKQSLKQKIADKIKEIWFYLGVIIALSLFFTMLAQILQIENAKDKLLKKEYEMVKGKIDKKTHLFWKGHYELSIGENQFRNPFGSRLGRVDEGNHVKIYYYKSGANNIIVKVER